MGLDMYLNKRTYVQRWDHQKPEVKYEVTVKRGGKRVSNIDSEKISYIIEQVGYWRKANSIHNWFVTNCAGGVDDCKEVYVTQDQIQELYALVCRILNDIKMGEGDVVTGWTSNGAEEGGPLVAMKEKGRVVTNPEVCASLMPVSGFFFGGTELDEWYVQDLNDTKEILEPLVEQIKAGRLGGDLYYEASW